MKKILISVLLLTVFGFAAMAQSDANTNAAIGDNITWFSHSRLSAGLRGGVNDYRFNNEAAAPGLSLGLVLGYDYMFTRNIGIHTGLEASRITVKNAFGDIHTTLTVAEAPAANYTCNLTGIAGKASGFRLQIPVELSLLFNRCYAHVGVKVAYNGLRRIPATGKWSVKADLTETGTHVDSQHQLASIVGAVSDQEQTLEVDLGSPLMVLGSIDLGVRLPSFKKSTMAIGLYGEFSGRKFASAPDQLQVALAENDGIRTLTPSQLPAKNCFYYNCGLRVTLEFDVDKKK